MRGMGSQVNPTNPARPDVDVVLWQPCFDTGIAIVDHQHHRLVELLNRLVTQFAHGHDPVTVESVLAGLVDYAGYHFQTEEQLWAQVLPDAPWTMQHRAQHQAFVRRVTELQQAMQAQAPLPHVVQESLAFLTRWLAEHILLEDQRMAQAYRLRTEDGLDSPEAMREAESRMQARLPVVMNVVLDLLETQTRHWLQTERVHPDQGLHRQLDTERILSAFATDFMVSSVSDFDAAIQRALQRSGEYLQADRTYVFLMDDNGQTMSNTHEWCAHGISPEIEQLQQIPVSATPWWWAQLRNVGHVLVPRVADLPAEAHTEQVLLQTQGIQSVCVYPLRRGETLIGFVGYDAVRQPRDWSAEVLQFLQLMGDLLSIALDHRRVFEQKDQALQRLERAERQAHLGHWEMDVPTGQLTWSGETHRIFGTDPNTLRPSYADFLGRVHPADRALVDQAYRHSLQTRQPYLVVHRLLLPDGQLKYVEERGESDFDAQGQARVSRGTVLDVTEKVQQQQALESLVYHDPLTGLPNRRWLTNHLQRALGEADRSGRALVLGFMDLDDFKETNERLGQAVGDQLLVTVGQRLRLLARGEGGVTRMGGDEFVVLLTDLDDASDCTPTLLRMLAAVNEPIEVNGATVQLSGSLGVTSYPQTLAVDGDQLLRQAQQALYQAKLEGKNRFHLHDVALEAGSRDLSQRLQAIQEALEHNEFVLYHQPKVNLRTGQIVGIEALLRWRHPDRGLLSPGEFLSAVHGHALETRLGEWVLREAMAQLQRWQTQGLQVQLSVNLGPGHIQQPDFVDRLRQLLASTPSVDPQWLQLEVLESSAMQDLARASQTMKDCRALGVTFALDDFGTGYSSLTYLKHLPATVLKIDQGFVRDMLEQAEDLSIIAGVVGMGRAFGLQVLAEGVETLEHGEMLLRLGCEQGQGYGIARPMPAEAIPGWVRRWRLPSRWQHVQPVHEAAQSVLVATVEHRQWVHRIEQALADPQREPPALSAHQCRLGLWLDDAGRRQYGQHPHFSHLQSRHEQLHQLAMRLVAGRQQLDAEARAQGLRELHAVRDVVLAELNALLN